MLPLLSALAGAAPLGDVVDLAVGYQAACALQSDGDLYCWGRGVGPAAKRIAQGISAIAGLSCRTHQDGTASCGGEVYRGFPAVRQLVRWEQALCALGEDGRVWCAGDWAYHAGGPRNVDPSVATAVPDLDRVVELGEDRCVLRDDGGVWCLSVRGPARIEGLPAVNRLAPGECAITVDRALWCWGGGAPEKQAVGIDEVLVGDFGSRRCARIGAELRCWSDRGGAVGRSWDPAAAAVVPGAPPGEIGLGNHHACGIDGARVRCWGAGGDGAWGDGTAPPWATREGIAQPDDLRSECWVDAGHVACRGRPFDSPTAPRALTALSGVDRVDKGFHEGCALADGVLFCFAAWRGGSDPEPGVARIADDVVAFDLEPEDPRDPDPVAVIYVTTDGSVVRQRHGGAADRLPIEGADQVVSGPLATCVRRRDGTAWCWDTRTWDRARPEEEPPTPSIRRLQVDGPVAALRPQQNGQGVCAMPASVCTAQPHDPAGDEGYHVVEVAP